MAQREEIIPIEWEQFDEATAFGFQFYDVTFIKPFASLKIGTKFPVVYIYYQSGVVETYDDDNNVLHTIKFIGVPIDEKKTLIP